MKHVPIKLKKSGQILLTQTNFQLCNRFKMKKKTLKNPKNHTDATGGLRVCIIKSNTNRKI